MRLLISIGLSLIATIAVWLTVGRSASPVIVPENERREDVLHVQQGSIRAVGSATCSGQSCHGASVKHPVTAPLTELAQINDRLDRWQSSYVVWLTQDRHAQAYQTLRSERSARMVEQLSRGRVHDATQETLCLACHSNPTLAKPENRVSHLVEEGVSCEACHGNSSQYIATHMNWTNGAERRAGYLMHGLTALNDIHTRAENCMGCHVGAPETAELPRREVNHDLIAAGHPRLTFELASYLRLLPPHWTERERFTKEGTPRAAEFEGKVWHVGQFTQAQMSLTLTQDRLASRTWPELAEFNCVACHHPVEPLGDTKQSKSFGQLVWQKPELGFPVDEKEFQERQKRLASVSEQITRPMNIQQLKEEIGKLSDRCKQAARSVWTLANSDALMRELSRRASEKSERWDDVKWLFDAAVVHENCLRERRRSNGQPHEDPKAEKVLLRIHNTIKFDPMASMYNYTTKDDRAKLHLLFAELWQR